jgi:hypothetical protein
MYYTQQQKRIYTLFEKKEIDWYERLTLKTSSSFKVVEREFDCIYKLAHYVYYSSNYYDKDRFWKLSTNFKYLVKHDYEYDYNSYYKYRTSMNEEFDANLRNQIFTKWHYPTLIIEDDTGLLVLKEELRQAFNVNPNPYNRRRLWWSHRHPKRRIGVTSGRGNSRISTQRRVDAALYQEPLSYDLCGQSYCEICNEEFYSKGDLIKIKRRHKAENCFFSDHKLGQIQGWKKTRKTQYRQKDVYSDEGTLEDTPISFFYETNLKRSYPK